MSDSLVVTSGRTYGRRVGPDFHRTMGDLAARVPTGGVIAELGAGAGPLLVDDPRVLAGEVTYYRVDISGEELAKGVDVGEAVVADVAAPGFTLPRPVDLAVSRMVAEHVTDGRQLLTNVASILAPGGCYLQVAPTLGALPFVLNRLLTERLAATILHTIKPRTRTRGKFPAHYSWCRGPTDAHLARIEALGLEVVAARGYFGHGYYKTIPPLHAVENVKANWLVAHPRPVLCSFTLLLLRRPS